jgi:hypothetical protein
MATLVMNVPFMCAENIKMPDQTIALGPRI